MDALRKRKSAGSANAQEWIDEYIRDVYVATEEDFKSLARLVRENSKNMKGVYSNAATKIYAHAIHLDYAAMSEVSEKLNFDEIEQALTSIWHAYEQVWQMFENGRRPSLEVKSYPYAQEVIDCVSKQVTCNEA